MTPATTAKAPTRPARDRANERQRLASSTSHRVTSATPAGDYERFCACVLELTGLDLMQYKRRQMERRLRSFYAVKGYKTLDEPCRLIRADPDALTAALDRITINVSQLWRNPEQWQLIESELLPELFESAHGRALRAWSAGCSYGAEAFTLASICHHHWPHAAVTITGTDIDRRMVARAKMGEFSTLDARSAPADALARDFERTEAGWRASPALRKLTQFETGDLLRPHFATAGFDLVLCRNTVIYFDEPIRDEVHARLAENMRPGSYLVVGATERVSDPQSLGLTVIHPFIYRKA